MALAVVISDPDLASGRALARQLEHEGEDIAVRAVVPTADDAAIVAGELLPDVALLTVIGDGDVSPAVRRLRAASPAVRVLLLSAGGTGRSTYPAMRAGASIAVPRWSTAAAHLSAIRDVAADRVLLPSTVAHTVKAELDRFQPGLVTALEDRILRAVGRGAAVDDVASDLGMAKAVIWRVVRGIRAKLEVADRVEALRNGVTPTRFDVPTVFLSADERAAARSVYAGGTGERGGPRTGGAPG